MYADQMTTEHVGQNLESVNGVQFGRSAGNGSPVAAHVLTATGLPIEGVQPNHSPYGDDTAYTLVTVWMGEAMVALTLNPNDTVVLADYRNHG